MIEHHRVLHVHPDAPVEVIRSSYRTLMQRLRLHPDLGGDHEHAAAINAAYAVLSDPEKRARYERERASQDDGPNVAGAREIVRSGRCPFCGAQNVPSHGNPDALCARCRGPCTRPSAVDSSARCVGCSLASLASKRSRSSVSCPARPSPRRCAISP